MKKSLSTLILISLVTLFVLPALMSVSATIGSLDDINDLVAKITDWFSGFVLAIAVIFILVAAWTFLTAGGNPDSVTKARQMLIYALVGIGVAVLAQSMEPLIRNILGV